MDPAPPGAAPTEPILTVEKVTDFLVKNPVVLATLGLLFLTGPRSEGGPPWRKGLPPVGGRCNGPWRGKGSFGHGFGPQVSGHR